MIRLEMKNCNNRESAKISDLSSGKLDKYEFLTGEEIQPADQRRVIFSPLEKAFEKQTKTIEEQEEKQIKAIEDNKKQLYNKQTRYNELLLSKEREKFKKIYNKRFDKIDKLSKTIDYGDLKFIISSSGTETSFIELKYPVAFLDSIRKREVSNEEVRHKQEEFNRYLKKIKIGNKSVKLKKKTLPDINKLFNGRNDAFKFVDDYGSMILEAKRDTHEKKPKPEPTKEKTKRKKSLFELHEKFINKFKNNEKTVNEEMFKQYFF